MLTTRSTILARAASREAEAIRLALAVFERQQALLNRIVRDPRALR